MLKKYLKITGKIFKTSKNVVAKGLKTRQLKSGFSLIELILYIAIVSIFLLGLTNFIWDIIYGRQKAQAQQAVEQSARIIIGRLGYEIRRATDFTIINSNQVQITNPSGTSLVTLNGNTLQLTLPNSTSYDLSSNQVLVQQLVFTDLSSQDKQSKQLKIELSLSQAESGSANFEAEFNLATSIELNTAFNQSRNLLLDLSNVAASANNRTIEGITLENTGNADLSIDQLLISWANTSGGENITQVQINGSNVWTGSQSSGSTLDLTNYVLSPTAGIINLDILAFDAQIDGGDFNLAFILGDGSIQKATFNVESSTPNPTPSPLLTPSPSPTVSPSATPSPSPTSAPSTCAQYCQNSGYTTGTCRQNAQQCSVNGETYLSAGDVYCTGGASADTCCCAP